MRPIFGRPVILHMIERLRRAATIDDVVIITSTKPEDDCLEELCLHNGINVYRGSELDLLDRHYQAAQEFGADFVVKIPSDCPLVDPNIVNAVISLWRDNKEKYDYVSNYHPPTFPDGMDVEGCTMMALQEAWTEAKPGFQREHTFPFIWDQPEKFSIGNVLNEHGDMFMTHRWTLDYEEDFQFIEAVYHYFGEHTEFDMNDILKMLAENPGVFNINSAHAGINWYRHHASELQTVDPQYIKREV